MLVSLSANHATVPLPTLEALARLAQDGATQVADAHPSILGTVVVSTCNRFEAYLDVDESWSPAPAIIATVHRLAAAAGLPPGHLRDGMEVNHGSHAARHLFAVTAGLESVAVGEEEIVGQVKRAADHARGAGTASGELDRLFQRAVEASREARGSTGLSESGRSLVRLALDLASTRVASWSEARVLLIGTGRYAATSLAALRALGVRDIRVHSVSGRAEKFAASHDVAAVRAEHWEEQAGDSDVIITCTSASGFVLDRRTLEIGRDLAARSDTRPRMLIDLGLPRTIDPDVLDLPGIDLLDLETIRIHAPIDEFTSVARARESVAAAARRFATSTRQQDVSDAIVTVRGFIRGIVDEEVHRLRSTGRLSAETERSLQHLGGVIMHRLTARGRHLAATGDARRWIAGVDAVVGEPPPNHDPSDRPRAPGFPTRTPE